MKTIKIPTYMNPFNVFLNGKKHVYPAGATVEVPDDVAHIIEGAEKASQPENVKSESPFGSGGGDTVLDTNGKLLNSVLPEGYPYKEESAQYFIPEQTVTCDYAEGRAFAVITGSLNDCVSGETYTVDFGGVEYDCVLRRIESYNMVLLGNHSLGGMSGGEDVPFCIVGQGSAISLVTTDVGSYTISVAKISKTIVPMSEDFLPKSGGGLAGFVVVRIYPDGTATCNMTREEYMKHGMGYTLAGGVVLTSVSTVTNDYGTFYQPYQHFIEQFGSTNMTFPSDCAYSEAGFDDDGSFWVIEAGSGPS